MDDTRDNLQRTSLQLEADLIERYRRIAEAEHISLSGAMRQALHDRLPSKERELLQKLIAAQTTEAVA